MDTLGILRRVLIRLGNALAVRREHPVLDDSPADAAA